MDPLEKITLRKSPEELAKNRCACPVILLIEIVLSHVEEALLDPRRGKKVREEILVEKGGLFNLMVSKIAPEDSPIDGV
jgi:hypothetical protein